MNDGRPDPEEWSLEDAIERWLAMRETDSSGQTVRGYRSRLDQVRKWCDDNGVECVADLSVWTIDEYQLHLKSQGFAPTTVKSRLSTFRLFLEYMVQLDLLDERVPDAIDIPTLSKSDEQNEERLETEHATDALAFFRESMEWRGTPRHAFLAVAWHTGARMGGIRALDLGDYHPDRPALEFRHRPSTDTRLKNASGGERWVGISDGVADTLDLYIARERFDRSDTHGREPLFATRQGRASYSTLRAWCYQATHPCLWQSCPHSKRRATCEWTEREQSAKCPSARSPHMVRTGSITWQLNQGIPIEVVAERVNAKIETIKRYYDTATPEEKFEQRRRSVEEALVIGSQEDDT